MNLAGTPVHVGYPRHRSLCDQVGIVSLDLHDVTCKRCRSLLTQLCLLTKRFVTQEQDDLLLLDHLLVRDLVIRASGGFKLSTLGLQCLLKTGHIVIPRPQPFEEQCVGSDDGLDNLSLENMVKNLGWLSIQRERLEVQSSNLSEKIDAELERLGRSNV